MKKIMMIFFALICLFSAKDVFAQDQYHLTFEKQEGVYFSRHGKNFNDDSDLFYMYKFNGNYAYCIEPGKHISTYTYIGVEDYVDLGFSEELKEKLELIGYYGREYPGHNNIRYSMAAQALIWELTGVDTVTFWTKQYEQGEEIDVTKERNEIMTLVNNHKTLPNFKTNYYGQLKREMTIYDTNKVLDNYDIIDNGGQEMYILNNTLHIMPKKSGMMNIYFKRKSYDEYNTIIFVGKGDNSSQKMGRLHFNKEIKTEFTLSIDGIALIIHKVDENNNPIDIPDIKFKIKDLASNEYICGNGINCTHQTGENGIFGTIPLDYGDYEIEEVENQIIPGYSWNSEKVKVTLNDDTIMKWDDDIYNYIDVYFKNSSVNASLEINKKGEKPIFNNNQINYQEINLANIYFDLYTSDNKFIKTIITDTNGYAKVNNLKVGKYYLIEKTKLNEYAEKDKINFEIKQDNQYQTSVNYKLNIKNELKKGKLEFSKVDSVTNKGIPNTIIEIYNENNVLLFTKETDSNGKVIIDNLPLGKYYIKEKQANFYYEKTSEIINFEIKVNNEVIKKTMTNKKLLGKVELEKYGEEFNITNNEPKYTTKPLSNIEFNLYREDGSLIDSLKTNENGYLSKELELGKYYLQEKTKLSNYKENNEKYYFEIKKDNNKAVNVKLRVNNYLKKGGVEFSKEELLTFNGIQDTIMEIYNDNNELLLTKKTDKEGKIVINNLPLGKYYFKEKEANFYFQITDELVPFEITNDGEIIKARLSNEKIVGNLEINKKGENYHFIDNDIVYENESLHGIEFQIYDSSDKLIGSIKTDTNGHAKYEKLPLGRYYLIEKTCIDKYVCDNRIDFEIQKGSNNKAIDVKLDIVNELKKGNLEFTKTDLTTSEGIPNTIVEIYNDKDMLLFTKETDEFGKVIINNLPIGKYYIIEKEANTLYMITNEIVFFEIKENGEIVKANMTNEKIEIPVPKTSTSEYLMVSILFGFSFLIGIGGNIYERKNAY